jgi:voltage-gated potassium channel
MMRTPKLTKVVKVVQLLRMIKIIKLMKNQRALTKQLHNGLKVTSAYDRLGILFFTIMYVTHLFACIWIFLGIEQPNQRDTWFTPGLRDDTQVQQYFQAFYFIVTTITTVGYGDMSGSTTAEHMFCTVLMIFGVFLFSTISGSLASVLASID